VGHDAPLFVLVGSMRSLSFFSFFPSQPTAAPRMNIRLPLLRPVHLPLNDADILALSVQPFQGRVGLTDAEVLTDLTRFLASRPICYEVTRAEIQEIARGLVIIPEDTLRLFIRHFIKHYAAPAESISGIVGTDADAVDAIDDASQ